MNSAMTGLSFAEMCDIEPRLRELAAAVVAAVARPGRWDTADGGWCRYTTADGSVVRLGELVGPGRRPVAPVQVTAAALWMSGPDAHHVALTHLSDRASETALAVLLWP